MNIKRLRQNAVIPTYAQPGDAGADLYSAGEYTLLPGERRLISTGIALEIPRGFVGLVHPRSGLAHKFGVTVANAPGTIDSGYRGEIMVNLVNHGQDEFTINMGDRIAQLVIQEVYQAHFQEVDELSETERGASGHGSTGFAKGGPVDNVNIDLDPHSLLDVNDLMGGRLRKRSGN